MLRLSFHGIHVSVESDSEALLDRLKKDFEFFASDTESNPDLTIHARLENPPWDRIPKSCTGIKTRNATIHTDGDIRFCDYQKEVLTIVDFKDRTPAQVFGCELNRVHEVTYLLILSRVGKILDRRGIHRIHAMGAATENTAILLTASMGAGKTTLFLELLKDANFEILSDDCPLVSPDGQIRPFPLRIGLKPDTAERLQRERYDFSRSYELDRMRFGKKRLLPISTLENRVAGPQGFERLILLKSMRTNEAPSAKKASAWSLLGSLLRNLVVGDGLPIMREYFIEGSADDFKNLFKIVVSRVRAALHLMKTAECYEIALSSDPAGNAALVRALIARSAGVLKC